jgi:hypothetical protein
MGFCAKHKSFFLKECNECVDLGGFACTASVSSPGVIQPAQVKLSDMKEKTGVFTPYTPDS